MVQAADNAENYWLAEFYNNHEFQGDPEMQTYNQLDFDWELGNPVESNQFSVIFTKTVTAFDDTTYALHGIAKGELKIHLNGELIFDNIESTDEDINQELHMAEGKHQLTVEYKNQPSESMLQLDLKTNLLKSEIAENTLDTDLKEEITVEKSPEPSHQEIEIYDESVINEEVTTENIKLPVMQFASGQTFSAQNNWKASFYPNSNFKGTPIKKEYDTLDLWWGNGSPDPLIPNDHFTAIFTKEITVNKNEFYRIRGRADDGIRIYVDDKLIINQWKDGVNPFHKDLLLSAGKHNIKVEYYEAKYSAAISVDVVPIVEIIGSDWEAAYFNNANFESIPIITQVKKLDLNWGSGSPAPGIPNDNFTATFHKKLNIAEAGEYLFSGRSDDGIRVYVNDKLVINKWNEGVNQYNEKVNLSQGTNLIRVEYLEKRYGAAIKLDINPITSSDWSATYYPKKDFTGTPVKTTHKILDLNWGNGSPAPGIPADYFSAVFEKKILVTEESAYMFYGRGDDGVRVYVDGKLIVDKWGVGVNNFETTVNLTKGEHTIKVEYYEEKYGAAIRLDYAPVQLPSEGSWSAKYYPSKNFTGTPVFKNIGPNLDLNWGSGSPAVGIPVDNFSAIFEKQITLAKAGTYHFTGRADDGYRVFVDGNLVINGWKTGVNQIDHLIDLTAGTHTIRVEYFEDKYSAAIKLDINEIVRKPNQWLATYYPNKNLTGLAVKRYVGTNLNLNWGNGSPASGIPVDNFSATFTKTLNTPETGTYQIVGRADDGIRVYVDGKLVINQWKIGVNPFNENIYLTAGNHTVTVQYFEEKYGAAILLDVKKVGKQENYKTSTYTSTYQQILNKQMATNPAPQTDLYGSKNGFVHKDNITFKRYAAVNTNNVRLRTSAQIKDDNIFSQVNSGTKIEYVKDITGSIVSGSTKWYEIKYQDKILYVHSSLVNLNALVPTINKNSNVHESANATSHIYGMLMPEATVTIVKEGATWHEIRYVTWRNSKRADVEKYLNPNNFKRGTKEYFQFLSLKGSSNVNENEINQKILAGKGVLAGKAAAFTKASKEHNVNEIYLISHSLLETGNGGSTLANGVLVSIVDGKNVTPRTVYNTFGIGAYDSCALRCGSEYAYKQGWFTVDAAIIGGAKFIGQNYVHKGQDTLYKMKWNPDNPGVHQYATDIGWAVKQTTRLYQYYAQLDAYDITFDVPSFK